MINITIQIVTSSASHDAVDQSALHLGGEIVGIHNRISEKPSARGRLGFGHINDVPANNIDELSFLLQPNLDNEGNIVSRSLWRVDSTIMTEDELIEVASTNELAADWTRFKEVCKNVVTGSNLTDGDI